MNAVFYEEWNDPQTYILSKTVGFSALMEALNKLVPIGEARGTLNFTFFEDILTRFSALIKERDIQLTSEHFSSSGADKSKLSALIVEAAGLCG